MLYNRIYIEKHHVKCPPGAIKIIYPDKVLNFVLQPNHKISSWVYYFFHKCQENHLALVKPSLWQNYIGQKSIIFCLVSRSPWIWRILTLLARTYASPVTKCVAWNASYPHAVGIFPWQIAIGWIYFLYLRNSTFFSFRIFLLPWQIFPTKHHKWFFTDFLHDACTWCSLTRSFKNWACGNTYDNAENPLRGIILAASVGVCHFRISLHLVYIL